MEWIIKDSEIEEVEHLLLPDGCHFADDAKQVITHWDSVDVSACAGSGKTTVLLAKLKLIADRMPLDNGAGICVLSHTNVAVNEIKNKLARYADKLMSYPNYIGTIQSFIDRFITIPYIRRKIGRSVQFVDGRTYAQHMLHKMKAYYALSSIVNHNCVNSKNKISILLSILCHYTQTIMEHYVLTLMVKKVLAGANKPSAKQFKN